MYSANLTNFLLEFWDEETKTLHLDHGNEIIQGCVITQDGELKNDMVKKAWGTD